MADESRLDDEAADLKITVHGFDAKMRVRLLTEFRHWYEGRSEEDPDNYPRGQTTVEWSSALIEFLMERY